MNPSNRIPRELTELLAKAVDASLAPEESERLEQMVRGNPERLRYMRDYLQLEVMLQAEAAVTPDGLHRAHDLSELPPPRKAAQPRGKLWSYSTLIAGGIAAAACLALMVFAPSPSEEASPSVQLTPVSTPARPPGPVATLRAQSGATWKGQHWRVGHAFREGDRLELLAGKAQISVGFGAELATKGPCTIIFVAHDRLRLESGEVVVHAAEWAKGYTVATSSMEVVDLGTTFTVSAGDDGRGETRVLKGLVRVRPRQADGPGERGLLVSEGERLSVSPDGAHLNEASPPHHFAESRDVSNVVPYRPVDLFNTGLGLSPGDEDAHWSVIAGPDGAFERPEHAMVCVPDPRYLANAPELSQWVSLPSWRTARANATYTFQTRFDLTGYDLSTTRLFGRFLADNGIESVRVNGRPVVVKSWRDNVTGQEFGANQFRFVDVTDGLVQGDNVVEIDVWNGVFGSPKHGNTAPNPMALRVEWRAFGRRPDLAVTSGGPGAHPLATLVGITF